MLFAAENRAVGCFAITALIFFRGIADGTIHDLSIDIILINLKNTFSIPISY
jgi:hypothetical protein